MEVWISVIAVALGFVILAGEPLVEILLFLVDLRDDLRNRNDRGRFKSPHQNTSSEDPLSAPRIARASCGIQ